MSKTILSPLAVSLLLLLTTEAKADLITWGPAVDATAATDVSTNGTLVTARNPWSGTFSSPTINGTLFSGFAPSGWTNGGTPTMNGSTSGDADYDAMLDGARATSESPITNPTGWGAIRLDSLGTLNMGSTYEIQVWYCEQRPGANPANPINDRVMTLSSATGNATLASGQVSNLGSLTQGTLSAGLEGDPNNMSGAGDTIFGQFSTGTFTRTSTDQLWLLVQGTHPLAVNLRPHINGFQIRETGTASAFPNSCNGDGGDQLGCTDCPCGNNAPMGTIGGCLNSAATSTQLMASGDTSVSLPSGDTTDLRFALSGAPSTAFCILNSGDAVAPASMANPCFGLNSGSQATAFDGLRCAVQNTLRHGGRSADFSGDVGVTNNPWGGEGAPAVGIAQQGAGFASGQTRYFQVIHRDDPLLVCTRGLNTSQAVEVMFTP